MKCTNPLGTTDTAHRNLPAALGTMMAYTAEPPREAGTTITESDHPLQAHALAAVVRPQTSPSVVHMRARRRKSAAALMCLPASERCSGARSTRMRGPSLSQERALLPFAHRGILGGTLPQDGTSDACLVTFVVCAVSTLYITAIDKWQRHTKTFIYAVTLPP